ncbi:MAG: DegT/DnrJ/EryC1/StrS family aminotransferase, partial [Fibrobacter sp.]|nr:DegT/DnrJ/EryC1/StrS family aminotransferase [Fibrobacter sp.]
SYKGKKTGTFGRFGCFSFYVTKNMTTGEGGMVLAQDSHDAEWVKMLALHGMSADAWKRFGDDGYKHYYVVESGFKYNMMDIQASIGIHQMKRLEENWHRREEIWNMYNSALSKFAIGLPEKPQKDTRHGYHLYTILVDQDKCGISRDEFLKRMTYHNIGVGVHYLSIPEHPFYRREFGWNAEDYPNAARVGQQTVSLPLSAKLTNDDVGDVILAVERSLKSPS